MKQLKDILIQLSEDDYSEMMTFMESNRINTDSPCVGIFWYNKSQERLFGVVKHGIDEYDKPNCSKNRISCSELHEKVWSKNFYKQKFKNNGQGDYIGQYQDKPRGRIFYNIDTDTFEICVGEWIKENQEAIDLIVNEFNLTDENYKVAIESHWNVGQSWR